MSVLGVLSGVSRRLGIWREAVVADRARPKAALAPNNLWQHRAWLGIAVGCLIWLLIPANAVAQTNLGFKDFASTLAEISRSALTDKQSVEFLQTAQEARRYAWHRTSLSMQLIVNRRWYQHNQSCVAKLLQNTMAVAELAKLEIRPDLLVIAEGRDDESERELRPPAAYDVVVVLLSRQRVNVDLRPSTELINQSDMLRKTPGDLLRETPGDMNFDGYVMFSGGAQHSRSTNRRHRAWLSILALHAFGQEKEVYDKLSICNYTPQILLGLLNGLGVAPYGQSLREILGDRASQLGVVLFGQVLLLRLMHDPEFRLESRGSDQDRVLLNRTASDIATSLHLLFK